MSRELRHGFDRQVIEAPFGVVFRDCLDRRVIADGLSVELSDVRRPDRKQRLSANGRGVFVAHTLPRLRPTADDGAASPPVSRRFSLSVSDAQARFLPLRLEAELPATGLYHADCLGSSPTVDEPHLPLYSAATRQVPAGLGEVRADLRLGSNPELAAAWARLELWLGNTLLVEGLADEHGAALLLCPLPPPREPPLREPPLRASPPASPFERWRWEVRLRVYWDPALALEARPEFCALRQAPEITPAPADFTLQGGRPLIARSPRSPFLFVGAS